MFGLFDRTKSASGRRCLKEWMLKPLHDIAAISVRQVRYTQPQNLSKHILPCTDIKMSEAVR